ncbi:hypothetical protein A4O66_22655 [Salmonella enterica subsp. enterica serovar Chester]|uniref:DUF551 domain-containing protein n=1 Tax=Salmonella typhimurium TaxID=90371 RepID=A0A5W8QUA2_SALTM|nr:hypothetical protein [Salmonella enterica subsp. enterica serovar Typhimurium]ECF2037024.1 hypothetical protein [Salmonella enterica subsp. enterica serovar Typhimurium]EDA3767702.1 hypothetical protein [Salmonella enterica subsp. enterica serovar Chester]
MTTNTSKFTKERLIDWAVVAVAERVRDLKDAPESVEAAANLKLAEIALASLTAEPVAWKYRLVDNNSGTGDHWKYSTQCITPTSGKTHCIESVPLYTAPPVQETGVYKDMLNIIGLLENNEWAEHCTSTVLGSLLESEITRLVGKEQSAQVVPEEIPKGLAGQIVSLLAHNIGDKFLAQKIWNACRNAILNGDTFRENSISSTNNFREIAETSTNSPVIPDGYALVPIEPTEEMLQASYRESSVYSPSAYRAMIAAAPQQEVE